jgi:Bacterial Ig-like domain
MHIHTVEDRIRVSGMLLLMLLAALITFAGCSETDEATDLGPFLLYSVSPEATSQPINIEISLKFNSAVDQASITGDTITLVHPNGSTLPGQFTFSEEDTLITFTLAEFLEYGKTYILRISPNIMRTMDDKQLGTVPEFSFSTIPTPQLIIDLIALVRGQLLPVCSDDSCMRGIINAELDGTEITYSDVDFTLTATISDSVGETLAAVGDGQVFYWGIGNNDVRLELSPSSANSLFYTLTMANGSDYYGPDFSGVFSRTAKVRTAGIEIESYPNLTQASFIYYGLDIEELVIIGEINFTSCDDLFFQQIDYLQAGCNFLDFDISADLIPPSTVDIRLECDMGLLGSACGIVGGAVSAIDGLAISLFEDVIVGLINEQISVAIGQSF